MTKLKTLIIIFFFSLSFTYSQKTYTEKGNIELGLRTTTSIFGHDPYNGLGVGGQTRLHITDYLSTEFFADWITIDLAGAGTRENSHIGWSILFYPKKMNRFVPYAVAGHCFDYAKVTPLSTPYLDRSLDVVERWSSAVQMGLGSHYYLNERFNLTFSAQYMMHLGKHLEYELLETTGGYYLETNHNLHAEERLEGHVLLTFSLNYKIADLW
tara:strand:+ start:999 stop:1634 length:636 start_codon:yes stop_codon:yes gene_type:complete